MDFDPEEEAVLRWEAALRRRLPSLEIDDADL